MKPQKSPNLKSPEPKRPEPKRPEPKRPKPKCPKLKLILENASGVLFSAAWDDLPDTLTIGRRSGNVWQVPAEDHLVSGCHASVTKKGNTLLLQDCGSKNGISDGDLRIKSSVRMVVGKRYGIGLQTLVLTRVEEETSPAPERACHRLEQLSGERAGTFWDLKEAVVTIGSDESCTVCIPSSTVSHVHAHIVADPMTDGYSVYDGDPDGRRSCNGTKVNGEPVAAKGGENRGRLLRDGDILSVVYADFRFLDRRVTHVRSHVLLKTFTVLVTLAVLVGGYFAFMSVFPSAKALRLAAEEAARRADFAAAHALIERSRGARGADGDVFLRDRLVLNIRNWEKTYRQWRSVRDALADDPNPAAVEAALGQLLSQDEGWRWNTRTAEQEKRSARLTFELIGAMFAVDRMMQSDDITVFYSESGAVRTNPVAVLRSRLADCREEAADYRSGLLEAAAAKLAEAEGLAARVRQIRLAIAACRDVGDIEKTEEAIRRAGGDAADGAAVVRAYLTSVAGEVHALAQAYRNIAKQECLLASFDFDAFEQLAAPGIPDAFVYDVDGRLAACAATVRQMDAICRSTLPVFRGWEKTFETIPWKTLETVFSEATLRRVLDCDCFGRRRPDMRSNRTPESDYDRVLGVDTFYAWLGTLTQVGGDLGFVYSGEHFVPMLETCRNVYGTFDNWMAFVFPEQDEFRLWVMTRLQEAPTEKNRIRECSEKVAAGRALRNSAVRRLLRTGRAAAGTREGIIAGGIACYLGDTRVSREALGRDFHGLVRKLREMKEADPKNPELLKLAVPGDPSAGDAWRSLPPEGAHE